MTDRLFVYGTLAPGQPNQHVLADLPGTWEAGSVRGRLLEQGWGAALGFPGIVLDADGPAVPGMVLSSPALVAAWERLDRFEGDGYERVPTEVVLDAGERIVAQIYVVRDPATRPGPPPSA